MNITITITNPTVNVLAALAGAHAADNAKMMESLDKASTALDALLDEIARTKAQPEQASFDAPVQDAPVQDAPVQDATMHDAPVQDAPIITPQDIDNYLDIGTEVHWRGAKYEFDGVVEKINDEMLEDIDDVQDADENILFIRRNDTDKLVSLTLRDLQAGRLTLID